MLLAAALVAALPVLAVSGKGSSPEADRSGPPGESFAVDTLIPRGHVLVPIEVANYEALDSILGKFGIVDLLQPGSPDAGPAKLVARNVRLLRAPQNPSHFAILIREADTDRILRHGGVFNVVIKRPEKVGTEFVKSPSRPRRKIVYDGGS